jgi:hypothetical protein
MTFQSKIYLGLDWIKQSIRLFKQHPNKWMALSSMYLFVFQLMPIVLLGMIDKINQHHGSIFILFFVGGLGLILTFSWPVFTSFIVGVFRETDANRTTSLKVIFNRVKPHFNQLIFLGAAFFIYRIIMLATFEHDIQSLDIHQLENEVMPIGFWWLILKLLLLQIPLLLATWYSPLLISYHQYSLWKSLYHSIWAALHNFTSLVTAWVVLTLGIAVMMLLLGIFVGIIAILSKGFAAMLGMALLIFSSLIAISFLFSIQYFSFMSMYYKKGEDFMS